MEKFTPQEQGFTSEEQERALTVSTVARVFKDIESSVGTTPHEKTRALFANPETLKSFLLRINNAVRAEDVTDFDGEHVVAGLLNASYPPAQEDKLAILEQLPEKIEAYRKLQQAHNREPSMSELAHAIGVTVNKLHLFADGNGRTSRLIKSFLSTEGEISLEQVRDLVVKKNITNTEDTTPLIVSDISIAQYREDHDGLLEYVCVDDISTEADSLDGTEAQAVKNVFPDLPIEIISIVADRMRVSGVLKRIQRERNPGNPYISFKEMFEQISKDADLQAACVLAYNQIKREEAELLLSAMLGMTDVPLVKSKMLERLVSKITNTNPTTVYELEAARQKTVPQ